MEADVTGTEPTADEYLQRLEDAAASLPAERRAELIDEVREHIAVALADANMDGATVRDVLDRLGPPEAIVSAEALETGVAPAEPVPATSSRPARPPLSIEARALLLLTIGAVVLPFLGPLIGLWVAAASARWSLTQKRTATLIVLVALAAPAIVVLPMALAGELTWVVTTGGFLLPFVPLAGILAATYLVLSSTVVVTVSRRTS
jgi:uncharacterized membrane protein